MGEMRLASMRRSAARLSGPDRPEVRVLTLIMTVHTFNGRSGRGGRRIARWAVLPPVSGRVRVRHGPAQDQPDTAERQGRLSHPRHSTESAPTEDTSRSAGDVARQAVWARRNCSRPRPSMRAWIASRTLSGDVADVVQEGNCAYDVVGAEGCSRWYQVTAPCWPTGSGPNRTR